VPFASRSRLDTLYAQNILFGSFTYDWDVVSYVKRTQTEEVLRRMFGPTKDEGTRRYKK
jgi:hypothetical protein